MAGNTPKRPNQFTSLCAKETRKRLGKCWSEDIDWNLYLEYLKQVREAQLKAINILLLLIRDVHRLERL